MVCKWFVSVLIGFLVVFEQVDELLAQIRYGFSWTLWD